MKEPWQVFHEELRRQISGLRDVDDGSADPMKQVSEAEIPQMSESVANAVLRNLVEHQGLEPDQALEVTKLLFNELSQPSSEPLADRLRRVWRQWSKR